MDIGIFRPGMNRCGGTETFLHNLIIFLDGQGHSICLVTDEAPKSMQKLGNVEVFEFSCMDRVNVFGKDLFEVESVSLFVNSFLKRVLGRVDGEVDVWSTHFWLENLLISRFMGSPSFFRFPGIKSFRHYRLMAKLDDPCFYVSNSRVTAKRAKENLGITVEENVYAGIDLDQFHPDREPVFENRIGDSMKVVYTGRVSEGKGLMTLLDAVKQIDDVVLYIVGDGSLLSDIKDKVEKEGFTGKVRLIGEVDHNEVPKWLVSCDVFCLPSVHEGFPVSCLEAMGCGLPVVVSNIPATREQVGNNGFYFEPENVEELRNKLDFVRKNPEKWNIWGSRERARAENFGWKKQAGKMEALYRKCVEID